MKRTPNNFRSVLSLTMVISLVCLHSANGQSKPWPVPKDLAGLTNPYKTDAMALSEGKTLYLNNCAPCHGEKGKGDGAAAAALNPKPADHTSPAMLNEADGTLFYKISEGRTPMPQYKAALNEKQRWELVSYIRTLCKATKK